MIQARVKHVRRNVMYTDVQCFETRNKTLFQKSITKPLGLLERLEEKRRDELGYPRNQLDYSFDK